jgi:hypothetical protein
VPIKSVTFTTTERDWEDAILTAGTLAALRVHLSPWARFVPEAHNIAARMSEREFREFRAGALLIAGGDADVPAPGWMERWQPLLMPDSIVVASQSAERYNVTLGTVLLGLAHTTA